MKWYNWLINLIFYPIRFPVGLFRVWYFEEHRKKSLSQILKERKAYEIIAFGGIAFLELIGFIVVILLLGLIFSTIYGIFTHGLSHD